MFISSLLPVSHQFLVTLSDQSPILGGTIAKVNVFIPGNASPGNRAPVLFYLSGLECSEDQGYCYF